MNISKLQRNRGEAGFTLVELAIVMIIIGLLIGGILKGQELVSNAQVTATIAQVKGFDGAMSTFRDKYNVLPGDMVGPNTRLSGCNVAPCSTGGNGNGVLDSSVLVAGNAVDEGVNAFVHMAAADLISGIVTTNGTYTYGSYFPQARIGGGFRAGYTAGGVVNGMPLRRGHYVALSSVMPAVALAGAADIGVSASQAAQMDRKLDDSSPLSGDVQANGNACVLGVGAAATYNEANENGQCAVFFRIQG